MILCWACTSSSSWPIIIWKMTFTSSKASPAESRERSPWSALAGLALRERFCIAEMNLVLDQKMPNVRWGCELGSKKQNKIDSETFQVGGPVVVQKPEGRARRTLRRRLLRQRFPGRDRELLSRRLRMVQPVMSATRFLHSAVVRQTSGFH